MGTCWEASSKAWVIAKQSREITSLRCFIKLKLPLKQSSKQQIVNNHLLILSWCRGGFKKNTWNSLPEGTYKLVVVVRSKIQEEVKFKGELSDGWADMGSKI